MMMSEAEKKHFEQALKANIRYDGRTLEDLRPIKIEKGVIATAEGSARVTMGETVVLAGVKMEIGSPYPDTPDEGSLMVGAEFLPMASPEFETGAPGIEAIELARVVDRGIRESGAIDTEKLCIESGKSAWTVIVDICTLNNDGNLQDVSAMAALAALHDAKFPKLETVNDSLQIDYKTKTDKNVPINAVPITVTVFKRGDLMYVDPTESEEKLYDSRLSISVLEDGKLCALQKGGEHTLSVDDINSMVDLAVKKSDELRKAL
ncbi:MAG: exosome complex protein Rrp42 [Candidatus Woesearchaeota archaeon]